MSVELKSMGACSPERGALAALRDRCGRRGRGDLRSEEWRGRRPCHSRMKSGIWKAGKLEEKRGPAVGRVARSGDRATTRCFACGTAAPGCDSSLRTTSITAGGGVPVQYVMQGAYRLRSEWLPPRQPRARCLRQVVVQFLPARGNRLAQIRRQTVDLASCTTEHSEESWLYLSA